MRVRLLIAAAALSLLVSVPGVWAVSGHLEGYLPSAAHAGGKFGSFWTTDVWIYQQGATVIHLWFNASGRDNSDAASVVVALDEPVVHLTDIVSSLFETEGIGSIHYLADGPVTVVSRTWTTGEGGGSYGQTVAGVPIGSSSLAGSGQGGALRMLVNQTNGLRANLGIVNVSPVPVTAVVEIFTADGQPAPGNSSFDVELAPFDMTQVNGVLNKRLGPGQRQGLIIRVGVTSGEGGVMAYLSQGDNTTNDASYQEAFRFAF
jgi:hypothetical protein